MFAPFSAFKEPVILEQEIHKNLKIIQPFTYSFMKEVEVVPLSYSELLSCSMYYPVIFGIFEGEIFPFAVLGVNRKNVYVDEEGFFKVEVIPLAVKVYPFGVIKRKEEDKEEWLVIVDKAWENDDGERLFTDEGNETSYFEKIKNELTEIAHDFQKAYNFAKEIYELGLLKLINFELDLKIGKAMFKNILIGNIEALSKIQPEKLYYLNTIGYLPIIYSIYFSVRNFKLFDLLV